MKTAIFILFILSFFLAAYSLDTNSAKSYGGEKIFANDFLSDDNISKAYRVLNKTGNYEEKKKAVKIYKENYTNERVLNMMIDLLTYSYDNSRFRENDQVSYYDDVIAQEMIVLLGNNGNKKAFSSLLKVVLYSRNHRDSTVKEAWNAIGKIKW